MHLTRNVILTILHSPAPDSIKPHILFILKQKHPFFALHKNAANCTGFEIERTPDRTPTDAPNSGLSFRVDSRFGVRSGVRFSFYIKESRVDATTPTCSRPWPSLRRSTSHPSAMCIHREISQRMLTIGHQDVTSSVKAL